MILWWFRAEPFDLVVNQAEIRVDAILRQTRILVGVLPSVFSHMWAEQDLKCTEYGSYLTGLRPLSLMYLCGDK